MRRRTQGKKNPSKITKSLLLIQIAASPGMGTDDLWDYMHARKPGRNMKRREKIYGHLTTLEDQGLITRTSGERKRSDTFTINNTFEAFAGLFNFLDEYHYKKELMQTPYYKTYTELDGFLEKYTVYRFKKSLRQINSFVKAPADPQVSQNITDHTKVLQRTFKVKKSQSKQFIVEYNTLVDKVETLPIDDLTAYIEEQIRVRAPKDWEITTKTHLAFLALSYVDKTEMPIVQEMLRDSPPVMEFLINSIHYDIIIIANMFERLTCSRGTGEKDLKSIMEFGATDAKSLHYNIEDLAEKYKSPYPTQETTLFQILRGLAICTQATSKPLNT